MRCQVCAVPLENPDKLESGVQLQSTKDTSTWAVSLNETVKVTKNRAHVARLLSMQGFQS